MLNAALLTLGLLGVILTAVAFDGWVGDFPE